MKDPARIPRVLEQLQRTWEAQPDLALSTLFGILENRGIGWGTDDAVLAEALADMEREHPGQVTGRSKDSADDGEQVVTGRYLVETESPQHRVTLDPHRISVRRPGRHGERPQPGIWAYDRIRRCRAGDPLVITAGGIDHRLGVVERISLLDSEPVPEVVSLDGLERRGIGDAVFHVRFDDGDIAVLDHGLEVYGVQRRSVVQRRLRWHRLRTARPGSTLVVETPDGAAPVELGIVQQITVLE